MMSGSFIPLKLYAEELRRRAAEHRDALVVGKVRRIHDVRDGVLMPWNRVIRPDDELARARFSGEVAQHFRREDERVVVHRPHIFRRLLLELDLGVAVPRRDTTGVVRARRIRRQETAAVRRAHLEIREPVERAFEDQLGQTDGGVERVADRVREPAVSFETLGELRRTLRVDEDEYAEVFAFLPERVELRV